MKERNSNEPLNQTIRNNCSPFREKIKVRKAEFKPEPSTFTIWHSCVNRKMRNSLKFRPKLFAARAKKHFQDFSVALKCQEKRTKEKKYKRARSTFHLAI